MKDIFSYGDLSTFIAASKLFEGYEIYLVSTELYRVDPILVNYFGMKYMVV